MERIIECVPNFSEGRNMEIINSIVGTIEASGGVKVLDVDPGEATNRTVVTFVGSPEAVVEAAFQGVKRAGELIDMRHHHGAHPRSGATDVLPLIPISGITLQECAELARKLAERIFVSLALLATAMRLPRMSLVARTWPYAAAVNTRRCRRRCATRIESRISVPENIRIRLPEAVPRMSARAIS